MTAMITIMKKELARFFGDSRMVLTTVLLPGLMIFLMYQFMGDAVISQMKSGKEVTVQIYQLPDSLKPLFESIRAKDQEKAGGAAGSSESFQGEETENVNWDIKYLDSEAEIDAAKDQVQDQKAALCIVFPQDFDEVILDWKIPKVLDSIAHAESVTRDREVPAVEIYYNAAFNESAMAYQTMIGFLDGFENQISNVFDVNPDVTGKDNPYNLATDQDTAGSMFASMLPMLLLAFLLSGCVSVAPESIAGEKERGTIATLLVTPIRRSDIALGKITALSLISLLSGASSALGTILSLPKLMQAEGDESTYISASVYHISDYLVLTVVIFSTVLVMVAAISILSAFAKSVKEAQTYVTPFMVIVILIGVSAMFGDDAKSAWYYYCIPLYNSVQCMVGIFSFETVAQNILITVVTNILTTGVGVFVLAKMFHSEKVIFS